MFFLWCNILLALTTNLEDLKPNPEENDSVEPSLNLNEEDKEKELLIRKISKQANFNKLFNDLFDKYYLKLGEKYAR